MSRHSLSRFIFYPSFVCCIIGPAIQLSGIRATLGHAHELPYCIGLAITGCFFVFAVVIECTCRRYLLKGADLVEYEQLERDAAQMQMKIRELTVAITK